MKICTQCEKQKGLGNFYRHPRGALGVTSKCKQCVKANVATYRAANIEKIREYDRERGQFPERKERVKKNQGRWPVPIQIQRAKFPEKYAARTLVGNMIRDGKIIRPDRCESCREPNLPHAHHDDYGKPLDITWLCPRCHGARHRELNALQRAEKRSQS